MAKETITRCDRCGDAFNGRLAQYEGRAFRPAIATEEDRTLDLCHPCYLLVGALEAERGALELRLHPPEKCKKCGGPADAHTRLPVLGPEAGLCLKCCPGCGGLAEAVGLGICKTCGSLTLKEDLEEGAHRGGCTLAGGMGRGN